MRGAGWAGCAALRCHCCLQPSQKEIATILEPAMFAKYERLLFQSALEKMDDITFCPRATCQVVAWPQCSRLSAVRPRPSLATRSCTWRSAARACSRSARCARQEQASVAPASGPAAVHVPRRGGMQGRRSGQDAARVHGCRCVAPDGRAARAAQGRSGGRKWRSSTGGGRWRRP